MKLTKTKLKQLVQEEIEKLHEGVWTGAPPGTPSEFTQDQLDYLHGSISAKLSRFQIAGGEHVANRVKFLEDLLAVIETKAPDVWGPGARDTLFQPEKTEHYPTLFQPEKTED